MSSSTSIKYKSVDVPVVITYKAAMFDLKETGINLLNIFQDQATISAILTDDETMLKVWFYFIKGHASTLEDAIEHLTPESMNEFREVFWEAVLNFINPQMRPALQEYMKMIRQELTSPGERLKKALSESSEEPE